MLGTREKRQQNRGKISSALFFFFLFDPLGRAQGSQLVRALGVRRLLSADQAHVYPTETLAVLFLREEETQLLHFLHLECTFCRQDLFGPGSGNRHVVADVCFCRLGGMERSAVAASMGRC